MSSLIPYFRELNLYFDHVYIMTLGRATQRHEKLKRVLEGFEYEFFFGADNKDFSIQDLISRGIYDENKAIAVHRYGKTMAPGAIGCAMTHKMVYEDMLIRGFENALIFEDDILPLESGLKAFTAIRTELPSNWELLYLDYDKNIHRNAAGWLKQKFYHLQKWAGAMKYSHTMIDNLYARPYSAHLMKAGYHDFGSAYAIRKNVAKMLVELQTPVAYPADHLLGHVSANKMVNAFITLPKLFEQESQFNKAIVGSYAEET